MPLSLLALAAAALAPSYGWLMAARVLTSLTHGTFFGVGAVVATGLVPAAGSWERYKVMEWLTFIGTELHKGFSPLFNPASSEDIKSAARDRLSSRFEWIAAQMAGKQYLMGDIFTVADGYLFTVMNWAPRVKVDLSRWPVLSDYAARIAARPAVQDAMRAEGLIK